MVRRRAERLTALAAAVLLAVGLAGCSDDGDPDGGPDAGSSSGGGDDPPATIDYEQYVAMGDSYTAAPLVPRTDVADPCLQSTRNYPHLVARRLPGVELVDVSCSGADTRSMRRGGEAFGRRVPSQLAAVGAETDLVTLSVGGNDGDLFGTLIVGCTQAARARPPESCARTFGKGRGDALLDLLPQVTRNVAGLVRDVQSRAPEARVVVVTYPQIVPAEGGCRQLPLTRPDRTYARTVNVGLARAAAEGAERAGVEWVDVFAATEGHDICADEPWINGVRTIPGRALSFHPFAEEQRVVADLLLDLLRG